MWLINSPIGRKVVMSLTGICLILFLTFHACMNVVALFSGKAYNMICELLGANWYAVVATLGLAFLAVCHIVFAFWLTMQNRKARGSERYAVTERRPEVSWASQNMLARLRGALCHLDCGYLVPSLSRFLECHADARRERQDLVQPLEDDRSHLRDHLDGSVPHRGAGICFRLGSLALLRWRFML